MRERLAVPRSSERPVRAKSKNTRRKAGVFLSAGLAVVLAGGVSGCGEPAADSARPQDGSSTPDRQASGAGGGNTQPSAVPSSEATPTQNSMPSTLSPEQGGVLHVECTGFSQEADDGFMILTPEVVVTGDKGTRHINTVVNSWGPDGDNLYMGRGEGASARVPESIYAASIVTAVTVVIFEPGQEPAGDHFTLPLSSFGVPERNVIPCGDGLS